MPQPFLRPIIAVRFTTDLKNGVIGDQDLMRPLLKKQELPFLVQTNSTAPAADETLRQLAQVSDNVRQNSGDSPTHSHLRS